MEEQVTVEEKEKGVVYELSYLFMPFIAEEQLPAKTMAIKDIVTAEGGVFITEEYPRLIELAYQMESRVGNKKEKYTSGYFGWMKFELLPEKIEAVSTLVKANQEVIRFLVVKTVKENTLISKRPLGKDVFKRKDAVQEPKVEINKEEVDAQIDALVETSAE